MGKFTKIIRIITVAPIMALIMLVIMYRNKPNDFGSILSFVCSIVFLTILPILAYPMQKYIPGYKDRGREGQRGLAMIFAVCGYLFGCLTNLCLAAPKAMWMIYLVYLFSGLMILILNKCFDLHTSGHACGVAGPISLLIYFGIPAIVPGDLVLICVYFASIKMKRHTVSQLLGGTIIPVIITLILTMII